MDIDFGDLDAPSKAPAPKAGKFAPKNSKFKPVAKPKTEPEPSEIKPITVPKVELDDDTPMPPSKPEIDPPVHSETNGNETNGSVKNDTDDMELDDNQEEEGEDKVVREIDVFFTSNHANSKLYVLQYPLRPHWRPYELDDRCSEVRVKPKTAEMELDMSVQADSENFDTDVDLDKVMRKQVLSTAWRPPVANGYAVGILIRNELYLKPVDAVVQLRPSMQHLKHRTTAMDEEVVKKEKSVKQVKKQGKPPVAVTEQNTDATPEEWIPLKYHGETSPLSYRYMENMVARQDCHIQFSMNQSDYIDSLCPATSGKPRPKGSSLSALLKLPLEERFKRRLVEGPTANRYTALKHIAPDASDEDIFKVLKEHAVLVQGWWVAKPKLKFSTAGGKDLLLRNYALLQLSRNPIFQEGKLPRQTGLSELVKVVLDEYAARRESFRDWKFRECPDESFIKNYPDIVKDQKENWDRVEPEIMARLYPKNLKTNIGDRRPLASNSTNAVAPKTATVPPSKPVIQDETREVLPKALQKLFHAYKVCSINQIRQRLRDMATAVSQETRKNPREVKDAVAAADAPLEELQRILTQIAVNIHGSFVLKSSPDHPQYDELRKIVIDLFLAEGPGGKLKKAKISAAVKEQLKRDMTNNEYQKVLSELCVSQSTGWVLKSGDSPT
ncbi:putative DNA-directed RNA polymerase III subunit Rpc5 [Helianthus annuus]|uniref:DNA-directed RNA polymerase III subunit Rpc5 n=1 Tax=Helianthus annuus TaxID=4232 RepID=A0A9K3N8X8_HELAN|nr:DNA-directed RNA polymerase III subunit RPC5 isoform X2 [Helianthus annuus]KAF5791374.1 putative DNA-directed RNA polymerase III subunit Rpc5 [Helianthus annuus]KAJ0526449.1 putative DNA-directed RNA polymerase III subunit Rpc5 [Helianthus annuus]KAJ0534883.1 putative DNA-directed RNA polymerase III subunit Rpc5 [Helianthus annuus]KAJ0542842.1 putative DNA-directed RNA polymerase III subunit Rpc5 [Helianthus annuus]KAJ0711874.1 putative DNA-directed RNA polymerase III subunit Rpc5 [Helianth